MCYTLELVSSFQRRHLNWAYTRKLLCNWRTAWRKWGIAGLDRTRVPKPGIAAVVRTARIMGRLLVGCIMVRTVGMLCPHRNSRCLS